MNGERPDSDDRDGASSRESTPHEAQGAPSKRSHGLLDPVLDSSDRGLLGGLAEKDATGSSDAGDDRWAHRRGEPRIFALLLSIYLLAAAMLTIFAAPAIGNPSAATFQAASRTLLALVAIGFVAIWPMTRLSQASPRRPVMAALADVVVVSLLAQAVIWPMTVLPGGAVIRPLPWLGLWPWSVAAGVAIVYFSWCALIGSMVACGIARNSGWGRAGWMLGIIVVAAGAPIALLVAGRFNVALPEWLALLSPITASVEFIEAPSGLTARMSAAEWLAAFGPFALSAPFWMIARARTRDTMPA